MAPRGPMIRELPDAHARPAIERCGWRTATNDVGMWIDPDRGTAAPTGDRDPGTDQICTRDDRRCVGARPSRNRRGCRDFGLDV